jgi:hypothetical protein
LQQFIIAGKEFCAGQADDMPAWFENRQGLSPRWGLGRDPGAQQQAIFAGFDQLAVNAKTGMLRVGHQLTDQPACNQ